jgi:hypothetical protein
MDEKEHYPEQFSRERWSAVVTAVMVVIALFLGWQVQTSVQSASRTVNHGPIAADVPTGWIVQSGSGDLIMVARNPHKPDQLYRVSAARAADDMEIVAANRNTARARLDSSYRVLSAGPVIVDGREGYKVNFARVNTDAPGLPAVIEGADYYFTYDDQALILTLESRTGSFAEALPHFQRFIQSVRYSRG